MDAIQIDSICIMNRVEEPFIGSCSMKDNNEDRHKLEHYWGAKKMKVQDSVGKSQPLSNSLEKHLMYCEYISEPLSQKIEETLNASNECDRVKGCDINDIPTAYKASGFRKKELIVIGTYIDKNIIPGFQYKVRKNFTEEYLFDGKALTLESVGLGYGKRLTFTGDTLNKNQNYFWSDSHVQGFGLTFQAIRPDTVFRIVNTETNKDIGKVTVNSPACRKDIEITMEVRDDGLIKKTVEVLFSGDVILSKRSRNQNFFYENMDIQGIAIVERVDRASNGKIKEIVLTNFTVENCLLKPEE